LSYQVLWDSGKKFVKSVWENEKKSLPDPPIGDQQMIIGKNNSLGVWELGIKEQTKELLFVFVIERKKDNGVIAPVIAIG